MSKIYFPANWTKLDCIGWLDRRGLPWDLIESHNGTLQRYQWIWIKL